MISVLILDGISEGIIDKNNIMYSDIYIPFLISILRYNGIFCEYCKTDGFEKKYVISGKEKNNIIYVPIIESCIKNSNISFIYTDSTVSNSISFRLACDIRNLRDENCENVVFINPLSENNVFKKFSPIIVDNIRIKSDEEDSDLSILKIALTTAKGICMYFNKVFCFPLDIE